MATDTTAAGRGPLTTAEGFADAGDIVVRTRQASDRRVDAAAGRLRQCTLPCAISGARTRSVQRLSAARPSVSCSQRDPPRLAASRLTAMHQRWGSPIYLAGESYGTTRGAALAALLRRMRASSSSKAAPTSRPKVSAAKTIRPSQSRTQSRFTLYPSWVHAGFTP